jgi:hypothetical protein
MWRHHRDAVKMEMKQILGVDELDPLAREYFEQHSAAAVGAYRQLREAEKQEVDNLKEKYKLEPNPLEVQQK